MEFPYIKVIDFPKHQKRERILSWIRFGIFSPENEPKVLYPLGLVDSGSDLTIIDCEFAEELGIEIKRGKKIKVYGVGGGSIEIWLHKIGFLIQDKKSNRPIIYQDLAGFAYKKFPASLPQQTAILGTIGFFRNVNIALEYPQRILVEPKNVKFVKKYA